MFLKGFRDLPFVSLEELDLSHSVEILATIFFSLAVLHTFSVKAFQHWAKRFPDGSVGENIFHLLGEVEIIFGVWSLFFFIGSSLIESYTFAEDYVNSRNFTEPLFVFAIMVIASTKPIIDFATFCISTLTTFLPGSKAISFFLVCLILGPALGSLITEPAAMTVTSVILAETFFKQKLSVPLKYALLGLLFVNVSIGGTLTHFAAPPVVMVATTWNWDTPHMLSHFGWKSIVAMTLSSLLVLWRFHRELRQLKISLPKRLESPPIISGIHFLFLVMVVMTSHQPKLFIACLLFFLGFATVTKEYQSNLKIREGLLVGFFLSGLVTLGGMQIWWVEIIVNKLDSLSLFISSSALTAIFDNAALTYLGSLVPDMSESSKYALVAGSVVGGGLTVIANAPNPIGYGILNPHFGNEGINPILLFKEAFPPTLIAALSFWILPT